MKNLNKKKWVDSISGAVVLIFALNVSAQPSMKVDSQGLGSSPLSERILQKWMIAPEKYLKADIESMLRNKSESATLKMEVAERSGFSCQYNVLSCAYTGYLTYRLSEVPPQNVTRANMRINFAIKIVNSNPIEVIVQTTEETIQ